MSQVGADAVLAKPLPKLRRANWKSVARAVVSDAPAHEPVATARWPGWASLVLAVGAAGLGWFAIIGVAGWLISRH